MVGWALSASISTASLAAFSLTISLLNQRLYSIQDEIDAEQELGALVVSRPRVPDLGVPSQPVQERIPVRVDQFSQQPLESPHVRDVATGRDHLGRGPGRVVGQPGLAQCVRAEKP